MTGEADGGPAAPGGPRAPAGPLLVVGTGLIGTSVALAARRAGADVHLHDADPAALRAAAGRGAGRPGWEPAAALVVVAVPPRATASVAADALARCPGATVTDVASVKEAPLAELAARGGDLARVVGGHPMAGREATGPRAARDDLFADRPWVLTPTPRSDPSRVEQVRRLALACGAVPVTLSPRAHDRAVALTSHTPQLLSSLLAARLAEADASDVAVSGQGLRDLTRVAGSDPQLWSEILAANAGSVAPVLAALAVDLQRVLAALLGSPGPDREALADLLRRGNAGRRKVPGRHGSAPEPDAVVPVMVADRPGELGRLFAAAGEAGTNLEDVRIEHVLGRPTGIVQLLVRPDAAEHLAARLRARGWSVRG